MKLLRFLIFIFSFVPMHLYSQIWNLGDNAVAHQILNSEKEYKLIYIFCDFCSCSQEHFPKVVKAIQNNPDVAFFSLCAQDSLKVAAYMDTCKVSVPMYLVNQNRKRRIISFYNPINGVCKYLKETLGINSDKMGASDYCILNRENKIIYQTNYDMKDDEYFDSIKSIFTH